MKKHLEIITRTPITDEKRMHLEKREGGNAEEGNILGDIGHACRIDRI